MVVLVTDHFRLQSGLLGAGLQIHLAIATATSRQFNMVQRLVLLIEQKLASVDCPLGPGFANGSRHGGEVTDAMLAGHVLVEGLLVLRVLARFDFDQFANRRLNLLEFRHDCLAPVRMGLSQ